ncbi:MAG: hypothetical protein N3D84_04035, partial [Candidatus Woesearchaeota archaeon]|nr:hypothetical protein [Candidatus Woesearchaeota archaeon]
EGISARVINLHTIKPIDKEAIEKAAKETGAIVTAEEHQLAGGMGSAVLEALAASINNPTNNINNLVPLVMVGVDDRFGMSGKVKELMEHYRLTEDEIIKKAHMVLRNKRFSKI